MLFVCRLVHERESTSALSHVQANMISTTACPSRVACERTSWQDHMISDRISTKLTHNPGFLYNLLTSADARSVQRRSAFFMEVSSDGAAQLPAAEDIPRRSNSLTLRRRKQNHDNQQILELRPSSAPHISQKLTPCSSPQHTLLLSSPESGSTNRKRREPLDLCVRTDCSDSETMPSTYSEVQSSPVQPMLRTILQRAGGVDAGATSSPTATIMSADVSPCSSPSAMSEIVQLSRKQAHVVRARVASWLKDAVDFALEKPVFVTLPVEVQLVLLRRAWPRLLLLSMAEHGCSFAVTSCQKIHTSSTSSLRSGVPPTRAFAESLLRIIELTHSLGLDEAAFNLLRLAALLKGKSTSLFQKMLCCRVLVFILGDNEAEVNLNQVHNKILTYCYLHLKSINRADYFGDVIQLLAVLSDIDKNMIESLLCGQCPNSSVDCFLDERFATVR